jgi:hypothetical protein
MEFKGVTLTAEVADEEAARETGLKFRKSLGHNEGMLFVFADSQPRNFWMKDTPIPLSIAFLDGQGAILNLEEMEPNTETFHSSTGPAQYALEMNKGWFTAHGAQPGDRIPGVLDAPPDREAAQKPPYSLDAFQLAWGKSQVKQMLKDRPEMASYVREGDDLWNWTVRQFAGEYIKGGVQWDSSNPSGDWDSIADGANPTKGKKACIQVSPNHASKTLNAGKLKTGPILWWEMAQELGNLRNRPIFDAINSDAKAGRFGRTDYAFECMAVEDIVTNHYGHEFFYDVWSPNCQKLSLKPMDQDFTDHMGPSVGDGWSREDFVKAFQDVPKPNADQGQTDFQKFIAKDLANHYKWYVALYDKYAPDVFTKKGLPIPPDKPSEETEKKFLDEIAPPVPTSTITPKDLKAMDSIPPPP